MAFRIGSDCLTAEVTPLGAELVRLADTAGRDYLWNGDPAYWSGRAPILFPIVGTLNDDRFRWKGREYSLPRHGFARRREFIVVAHDSDSLLLRLEADGATREVWPFDFALDMAFAIRGSTLTMTATVTNRGGEAMPVSFGFHPALRWPLPGARDASGHRLRFERPEPAPVRRLDESGLLASLPQPSPIEGDLLRLDESLFVADALILDRVRSRSLVYEAPGAAPVEIDFRGMPYLGLWSKPGAAFLCIEPWQGHSDPAGFEGTLEEKPGVLPIAPGMHHSFGMSIAIGQEKAERQDRTSCETRETPQGPSR